MKVIWNSLIPVSGYSAINLFGVVFCRKSRKKYYEDNPESLKILINHEAIHTAQMGELLYVFFYLLYFTEWLFRMIFYPRSAYYGISFEKEAYKHEKNLGYLEKRKHFAQWRHA